MHRQRPYPVGIIKAQIQGPAVELLKAERRKDIVDRAGIPDRLSKADAGRQRKARRQTIGIELLPVESLHDGYKITARQVPDNLCTGQRIVVPVVP